MLVVIGASAVSGETPTAPAKMSVFGQMVGVREHHTRQVNEDGTGSMKGQV